MGQIFVVDPDIPLVEVVEINLLSETSPKFSRDVRIVGGKRRNYLIYQRFAGLIRVGQSQELLDISYLAGSKAGA